MMQDLRNARALREPRISHIWQFIQITESGDAAASPQNSFMKLLSEGAAVILPANRKAPAGAEIHGGIDMKHTSRLFGEFQYTEDQVITFPAGLLGFPESRHYVLKANAQTAPVCWLLAVEDGGPELALIDPELVAPEFSLKDIPLDSQLLEKLRCRNPEDLLRYAIVTLPENIKQMSMNLRTPIFIDPLTRRGIEYPKPGLEKKPVRCLIYRELIASRPEDKPGLLLMMRKENETVEIGDEISIQVMEFTNGGVRLGITAPKHLKVSRGDGKVTPLCETKRANEKIDPKRLEGVMKMHQIMQDPEKELYDTNQPAPIKTMEQAG